MTNLVLVSGQGIQLNRDMAFHGGRLSEAKRPIIGLVLTILVISFEADESYRCGDNSSL